MTYVVTEACVNCKYTDCAAVCPVEAFHELPDRLLINPDNCIDCDACVPECPVEAIYPDVNAPELDIQAATGLLAIVVLLVIMNWFFHKVYWAGWIAHHNNRKRRILETAEETDS